MCPFILTFHKRKNWDIWKERFSPPYWLLCKPNARCEYFRLLDIRTWICQFTIIYCACNGRDTLALNLGLGSRRPRASKNACSCCLRSWPWAQTYPQNPNNQLNKMDTSKGSTRHDMDSPYISTIPYLQHHPTGADGFPMCILCIYIYTRIYIYIMIDGGWWFSTRSWIKSNKAATSVRPIYTYRVLQKNGQPT
jgi:hypothetical protein